MVAMKLFANICIFSDQIMHTKPINIERVGMKSTVLLLDPQDLIKLFTKFHENPFSRYGAS